MIMIYNHRVIYLIFILSLNFNTRRLDMMRCPICNKPAHTRTSRYLTKTTKETYYQCQNITCSCTFKTIESLDRVISKPDSLSLFQEEALN